MDSMGSSKENDTGVAIDQIHATSVQYMLTTKLDDKQITETCQKHLTPKNCERLVNPTVNPNGVE